MEYRKAGLALIEQGISDTLCPMKPDLIHRTEIISFAEKIRLHEDLELTHLFPDFAPARIVIHSIEGDFKKFVKIPLGDPANPMDLEMIENKINLIAAQNSFSNTASRIVDNVRQIETAAVRSLSNILGHKLDSGSPQKR